MLDQWDVEEGGLYPTNARINDSCTPNATWSNTLPSKGNDIETKAERSFDLGFDFDIEAKRTCLFQNL